MIVRRFVSAAVALLSVAACSSSGSSTQGPVTLDLGPTVATVAVVATDSPTPDTTIVAIETTTTTELVITTTIDPKAEVEAAYLAALAVRNECNYDPINCDFAAIAVPGSPQDLFTRETMQTRIDNNLRSVVGIGSNETEVGSITVGGDVAFLIVCSVDAGVLFDVGDPATPTDDVVFDDSTISLRVQWEMRKTDGVWLMFEGLESERLTGGDLCAD